MAFLLKIVWAKNKNRENRSVFVDIFPVDIFPEHWGVRSLLAKKPGRAFGPHRARASLGLLKWPARRARHGRASGQPVTLSAPLQKREIGRAFLFSLGFSLFSFFFLVVENAVLGRRYPVQGSCFEIS